MMKLIKFVPMEINMILKNVKEFRYIAPWGCRVLGLKTNALRARS